MDIYAQLQDGGMNRIRELRTAAGMTQSKLAELVGVSPPQMHWLESGQRRLSAEMAAKIAKNLDCRISDLLECAESAPTVALVGYVGAGDMYYPDPEVGPWNAIEEVESPPGERNVVAVRVRGNSMFPACRNGDLIYFRRDDARPEDLIGQDCVVALRDGRVYVKTIYAGTKPGRFRLKSYNQEITDMHDQEIEWVAKVLWVRRS